ncbi:transposase [Bacillus thuringiensis serovar palmanyolensis]|uniref:Transposase OrfB n=1 Tax=Bacillus thuringiensis HD-771 TaxID=1218175 RepID=A0A9W3J452_BACTU|nr:transposase OrfB [Bacillus thuringiensis HD-771]AND08762.1 transposase [Bacillus thuringiensis serovar alesti]OUB29628.1 transposase [Bacillus thuringiensis serovar palmanyolensis]OUB75018.1 transposase [Bacillus thuringiensis serovar dakota]
MGVKKYFFKKYIFISKIKTINLKKDNQIDGFLIISIKLDSHFVHFIMIEERKD